MYVEPDMNGMVSILVRSGGVVLVTAALLKAAEPWVLRDWLFFAAGGAGAEAYWARAGLSLGACLVAALVIVAELAIGLTAVMDPVRARVVLAWVWAVFLGVHAAGVLIPGLGLCPCLGRHVLAESPVTAHLVWCGLSGVFLAAALLVRPSAGAGGTVQGASA
jgi:hypothetical protein